MSPELDEKLCKTYPKIFKDRHGDRMQTCMYYGFSCDDGWFNIINSLCAVLQNHVENERYRHKELSDEEFDEKFQIVAAQVKEKFGGLRFYIDNHSDFARGAISAAESMSLVTCECCGNPGKSNGDGWIRTRCSPCSDKEKVQREEMKQKKLFVE